VNAASALRALHAAPLRSFLALVLAVPLLAGACASRLPRTPQSFTLDAPPAPASPAPGATRIVALRAAEASPVYAGAEFVYRVGDHAIERDPYASFATPPAWMLTSALRGYLRGADFIRDVVPPGEGVPVDAEIEPALTEIAGDFSGAAPEAVLVVHFRVLAPASSSAPEREILLKSYTARRPIARHEASAVAAAWNEALAAIAAEFLADLKAALPPPRPARVG
jgi:ABC-type uncharacterized transport system auxiliary subunit